MCIFYFVLLGFFPSHPVSIGLEEGEGGSKLFKREGILSVDGRELAKARCSLIMEAEKAQNEKGQEIP